MENQINNNNNNNCKNQFINNNKNDQNDQNNCNNSCKSDSWSSESNISENSFVINYFDPIYAISDDQEYTDPYSPTLDQKMSTKFNENIHTLSSNCIPIVSTVEINFQNEIFTSTELNNNSISINNNIENNNNIQPIVNISNRSNINDLIHNELKSNINIENIISTTTTTTTTSTSVTINKSSPIISLESSPQNQNNNNNIIYTTPKYKYTPIYVDQSGCEKKDRDSLIINAVELIPDSSQTNHNHIHTPLPQNVYETLQGNNIIGSPLKSVSFVETHSPSQQISSQNNNNHSIPDNNNNLENQQQPSIQKDKRLSRSLAGLPITSSRYQDLRKSTQYLDLKSIFSISKAHQEEIEMLSNERYELKFTEDDPTLDHYDMSNHIELPKDKNKKESGVLFGKELVPQSPEAGAGALSDISTNAQFDSPKEMSPFGSPFGSPAISNISISPDSPLPITAKTANKVAKAADTTPISTPESISTDETSSPVLPGETRVIAEVDDTGRFSPKLIKIEKDLHKKKEKKHFFRKKKDTGPPALEKELSSEEVLSEEGKNSMKVISELLNKLFNKKKYSTLTIFMGLALLHSYYKELIIRNYNCINNRLLLEEGLRYQKFCTATYGRKLYYGVMGSRTPIHLWKGIAGTDSINVKVICKHTGVKKQDIIATKWYSSKYSPGHFVAIDHQTKSVVLAIRGTFNHFDVVTDLVAKSSNYSGPNKKWESSTMIHLGMVLCAHKKLKEVESILLKGLHANPGYRLIVTGHSLGAGVASIFTFLFYDIHPEIPIHCYSYGPPCILNYEAASNDIVKSLITSFAMNDDIVPRLSFNSLFYLREVLDAVLSQSKTRIQRGFHIISAGNGLGEKLTNKISKILKVSPTIDLSHVEHTASGEIPMFPPGKIIRMVKVSKGQYVAESVETKSFDKIIVSVQMFTDHMPNKYEKGLESALKNMYNEKLTTPPQGANLVEGRPAGQESPSLHVPDPSLSAKENQPQASASLIPTSLKASYNSIAVGPQT